MKCLVILLCFYITLLIEGNLYNDCEWIKDEPLVNSIPRQLYLELEQLPAHKYLIIESCLYYHLTDKARRSTKRHGTLKTSRPSLNGEKLVIKVDDIVLRKLHLTDAMKSAAFFGVISASWKDSRLQWDSKKWKTTVLKIKNPHDIWIPSFVTTQGGSMSVPYNQMHHLHVQENGTVNGLAEITPGTVPCETDYRNFPKDQHKCCFSLEDNHFSESITYDLTVPDVHLSPEFDASLWKLLETTATIQYPKSKDSQAIEICMQLQRDSRSLELELSLPMALAATFVLISPMFGRFKIQIIVKLFALLLQFLCFQFLTKRSSQVGLGSEETPKIYKFYEITTMTTVASFLTTLVIYFLDQKRFKFPPNHNVSLATKSLNGRLLCYCIEKNEIADDQTKSLWHEIFEAIHSLMSIIIICIYLAALVYIFGQ